MSYDTRTCTFCNTTDVPVISVGSNTLRTVPHTIHNTSFDWSCPGSEHPIA